MYDTVDETGLNPCLYPCVVAVDKAYKLLLDPEQKKRALDVIQAGKEYIEHMVSGALRTPLPSVCFIFVFIW